jgi:hypothetical protein
MLIEQLLLLASALLRCSSDLAYKASVEVKNLAAEDEVLKAVGFAHQSAAAGIAAALRVCASDGCTTSEETSWRALEESKHSTQTFHAAFAYQRTA